MITILMATYNGEKYISEQIESILKQSYKDFELYIRDDGSTDKTVDIISKYAKKDKRITIMKDKYGNLGFAQNFMHMLSQVESEYYMFSDQDDIWYENKIEKLLDVISVQKKNTPILVHSDSMVEIDGKERRFLGDFPLKKGIRNSFFKYVTQGSTMMINNELKSIVVENYEGISFHDRYIQILSEIFGIRVYVNEPLSKYRQHENNIVGSQSKLKKAICMLLDKNRKFYYDSDLEINKKIELYFKERLNEEQEMDFDGFFYIVDEKKSKIDRLIFAIRNKYYIPFIKKILLIIR